MFQLFDSFLPLTKHSHDEHRILIRIKSVSYTRLHQRRCIHETDILPLEASITNGCSLLMKVSMTVLRVIKEAQQKHGLRHGDFQRYRGYCSRRIRRLRSALHFLQGTKNRYNPKSVSEELLVKTGDLRYPCIVLMQVNPLFF